MRKLYLANGNDEFKFADTMTKIRLNALDDNGIAPLTANAKVRIKNSSGYLLEVSANIVNGQAVITSGQLAQLPPGNYLIELWDTVNGGTAIYPSEGFLALKINENITGLSGNIISSITVNDFTQQFSNLSQQLKTEISTAVVNARYVPEVFANSTDLKNAYPSGKNGVFVTADTGHMWVFVNGDWKDIGVYKTTDVDQEVANARQASPQYGNAIYASAGDAIRAQTSLNEKLAIALNTGNFVVTTDEACHGYFLADGITYRDDHPYKYIKLPNNINYRSASFVAKTPTSGIVICKKPGENTYTALATEAGNYTIDLTGCTDIYLNLYGDEYVSPIQIFLDTDYFNSIKTPKGNYTIFSDNKPNNLIVRQNLISGYYIGPNGAVTVDASGSWSCTDFIDISGISTLYGMDIGLSAFYDSDKKFIKSQVAFTNYEAVQVPDGAKYIRSSVLLQFKDVVGLSGDATVSETGFDDGMNKLSFPPFGKRPYASGLIKFSVNVNQKKVQLVTGVEDTNLDVEDNFQVANCMLKMPTTYTQSGKPTKLLMLCHGAGGGIFTEAPENDWTKRESYLNIVNKFVDAGYFVFDCSGINNAPDGFNFFGDIRGVEAYRKALDYVRKNYNVENDFSIYGFSMGGLTALQLARSTPSIKCIALGSPVLSLTKWNEKGGNIVGVDDPGRDSYKNVISINDKLYNMSKYPPLRLWYGTTEENDQVEGGVSKNFVESVVNSGGIATIRWVKDRGHEICFGEDPAIIEEYLSFINRFNG